ncbi:MAG: HAD-IA family hydrolase [Catonella sp.]|nr:HAD-IA family hydrolase [Catonella sp.]MDY6357367.1 HAD-IA family hydrolase [Catonella sp.]
MSLKYKCLVMDHDDTVVNSTATVHFPSFVEFMDKYFPEKKFTLEEYFKYNFDPGVVKFFREICGMTEEDVIKEQDFWRDYVKGHVPKAFPGIKKILTEQKRQGGIIAVVSHSYSEYILRDYRENDLPNPDITYGWEVPIEIRKPKPWALEQIMKKYNLKPEDMIVIDDLKPGFDMAKAAGVPFAAAGWANDIPEIENFMRSNTENYFKTIDELYEFLFS